MEYMSALEKEIAMEVTIADIGQKVMSIFKFIGELIRKAIKVLTELIGRLKKTKGTSENENTKSTEDRSNMNATPNTMKGAGAEVMTKEAPKPTVTADIYDCGNELEKGSLYSFAPFCLLVDENDSRIQGGGNKSHGYTKEVVLSSSQISIDDNHYQSNCRDDE